MQKFKSHKVVEAAKIFAVEPTIDGNVRLIIDAADGDSITVGQLYNKKHAPKPGGYYVRYPDGYESFSPAQAFEEGYTRYYEIEALRDMKALLDAPYPAPAETLSTGQPKITGYRNLSPIEIDLMNEGKALAEQCGAFIAKLRGFPATESGGAPRMHQTTTPGPHAALPSLDLRWVAIGATDLQKGWMSVIRGIVQPTTF